MLRGRALRWALAAVLLLLAVSAPAALAQGITNGGKTVWSGDYTLPSGQTLNGDLTVLGGNATLGTNSTVNGNLTVMGGNAIAQTGSVINGGVTMMGGTLQLAGRVRDNVGMLGGSLDLADTAVVNGNISRVGGSVRQAAGAVVGGSTVRPSAPELPSRSNVVQQRPGRGPLGWFLDLILRLVGATGLAIVLALIGAVVLMLAPRYTGQVATTAAAQPALNFAAGLLTLVLAFLVGIPLLLVCGLGALVWLAALLTLLFGWIAVGLWVGQQILNALNIRGRSPVVDMVVGVFLITWLERMLPCLGWLFGLVLGSIGVGAVLLTRFGTQRASGLSALNWGGGPLIPGSGPHRASPPVVTAGGAATYSVPAAPSIVVERPSDRADIEETPAQGVVLEGQHPLPPAGAGGAAGPSAEAPASPESGPVRSLENLGAVRGITPEIADRLRAAGTTTLVALATSDPATLAGQAGVGVERVRDEDWIGQARRMLG